ncbi:MAG: rod shape-determining protein MreC [Myxococcota bacterium]
MWRFLSRFKTLAGVVILALLPFVFLKAQKKVPALSEAVAGTFLDLSSYFQKAVLWAFGGISDALETRSVEREFQDEIFALRSKKGQIRSLEILLSESEREIARLKDLLHFSATLQTPRALGASVIGQVGTPLMKVLQVDQGSKAGVKKGDAVVTEAGAVGQVILTGKLTSEILLLSDASSAVDIIVGRSRAKGIMRGLRVTNFDRLGDVRVGDVVVTSGLGARFPEGMPVGQITRVQNHRQGLYTEAEIRPFVDYNRLEQVLLLTRSVKTGAWHRREMTSELLRMSVRP